MPDVSLNCSLNQASSIKFSAYLDDRDREGVFKFRHLSRGDRGVRQVPVPITDH